VSTYDGDDDEGDGTAATEGRKLTETSTPSERRANATNDRLTPNLARAFPFYARNYFPISILATPDSVCDFDFDFNHSKYP